MSCMTGMSRFTCMHRIRRMRHDPARRRLITALCALAACVVGVPAARAQEGVPPPASQPASWPPWLLGPTRAALEALADSARRAGLPAAPLYAKAAEGVLKGADDARIVSAVRTLRRELAAVRAVLGPAASVSELVAGASAVHAGVPAATLHALGEARARAPDAARRARSLAVPFVVAADLVLRGVSPDVAAASMTALLARGAPDAHFSQLWRGVEQDILAGHTPSAAAMARTRALVGTSPVDVRPPDDGARRRPPGGAGPDAGDGLLPAA